MDIQASIAKAVSSFREYDTNGVGFIDKNKLGSLFQRFGWKQQDVDDLLCAADKAGDGRIKYEDFVQWLSQAKCLTFKVCVMGGAGGIGQPLSMLLAMDERVGQLCVVDLSFAMVPPTGVAADLGHLEMPVDAKGYTLDPAKKPIEQLEECLTGCDLVIIPAGMPRKPGMTRDDLFKVNADIARDLCEACAKFCPDAILALIVNPVNSIVPAMCELYKKKNLDPKKILGITTLDVVRANKFVAGAMGTRPTLVDIPVIGGHAGVTIMPVLSACEATSTLSPDVIKALDERIQNAGTEVVNAKGGKGSATLSMAYAGARLAKAVLSGLSGFQTEECAYVPSNLTELPYFASKCVFGITGVEKVSPLPPLNAYEQGRLQEVFIALRGEIKTGMDYAANMNSAAPAAPPAAPLSFFENVAEAPADPILNTTVAFKADVDPKKINLGVGAYRTPAGKPYVLPAVIKAEEAVLEDIRAGKADKEYSTIDGPPELKQYCQALLFGENAPATREGRIASAQALSGTGALRVVGEFIKKNLPAKSHIIYLSEPTWGNHDAIFKNAGLEVRKYPYYKAETRGMDFDKMIAALREAPLGASVLLHACAHNPTGVDPTDAQWGQILDVLAARQLVPIMDSAYQGYATGSLEKDAYAVRLFESKGMEFFLCQSFAKNLGLYGERIGMVHVVCKSKDWAAKVLSQLKVVIRPMYSSPPIHGAQLVIKILGNATLKEEWKQQLKEMADRILDVRQKLRRGLESKGTPGTWNHVTDQIGMFSYTGMSTAVCERLISTHHIYLLKSGRISLAGLNDGNLQHMIDSVDESIRACP